MLIAVAITLVMMAAVVTLFANISDSVRNRRATLELSSQLRQVRNMLQQDLAGATCPGVTWQRPESNHGYLEFIEGVYRDTFPSILTDGDPANGELDFDLSMVPRANDGTFVQKNAAGNQVLSTVSGLGDYDDILMFTSRNEHEPYVGRVPKFNNGSPEFDTLESPLAEVIWYAIENPQQDERANGFFGEPGMRTIYRRALLIAPWLTPANPGSPATVSPGVVRLLDPAEYERDEVDEALAALIAFQDQYDLSVRLEWDALALNGSGQWKIVANTLADLTKRENRFGHYQYHPDPTMSSRRYPYAIVSAGTYSETSEPVKFVTDPARPPTFNGMVSATANLLQDPSVSSQYHVASYTVAAASYDPATGTKYATRPFAHVDSGTPAAVDATANVMLNDDGQVVRVVQGPVPLWGKRRGEDVMLSNVLAFDLRVYDPGAPIYQVFEQGVASGAVLEPTDPGWRNYYSATMGTVAPPVQGQPPAGFVGQGAYVDMGYTYNPLQPAQPLAQLSAGAQSWILPWFAMPRALSHVSGTQFSPGYAVYDTWSLSYENNGLDDDGDGVIDQGANGLDDRDFRTNAPINAPDPGDFAINGPDDAGERETAPPYDKPLRGIQVVLRVYERDSRQILQSRVDQHFLTE
jgi:hypothetical protein